MFLFSGFNVIVFFLSGKVARVLKCLFSQFGGALWGAFFLFIWVWKVWVFLCFLVLLFFLVLVLFLFVCFVLFCGWMLLFLFHFLFYFLFWPKGPPHLALNPPYFFVFVCFPFIVKKEPVFLTPKKGKFCLFICVSLCFSLAFFGPPPFLSLSLSLSLSCYFLSSFLPVFASVSGSCFFFLFCLLLGSRCYFVVSFLLVVLFCFESSCLISFCFAPCFLVVVFCFLLWYFVFLSTYQKHLSNNWKLQKKTKNEKCRKKRTLGQEQLAQVCSQIVSFLCFFKFSIFAETTKQIGVSAPQKRKNTKKTKILVLKTGPTLC